MAHGDSWILPPGTHVVLRIPARAAGEGRDRPAGATAVVLRSPRDPEHPYRVRFPDGGEATVARRHLGLQKHHRRQGLEVVSDEALAPYVIYEVVVGSQAWGLATEGSDTDLRGVYLPPADLHWSLYGVPEQIHDGEAVYWELQKFLRMALKANPNVLECLWSPHVRRAEDPVAQALRAQRGLFLTKLVHTTYNGYALGQFKKLEADLRRGEIRWKHAMHLVRILLSGIEALETGELPVDVGAHRDRLLAIKAGELPWEEVDAWRKDLHRRFDEAFSRTRLPERPDHGKANDLLVEARRSRL